MKRILKFRKDSFVFACSGTSQGLQQLFFSEWRWFPSKGEYFEVYIFYVISVNTILSQRFESVILVFSYIVIFPIS